MSAERLALVVMAKAPRPGLTKTRLEPLLGPEGCAALQRELLSAAARWAAASGDAWISYTPADAGAEVRALVPAAARGFPQPLGHLGVRLDHAFRHVAALHAGPVAVVATDQPALAPVHAGETLAALADGADVVLGPALDGGYYLLAARRPHPALFDIAPAAWGGPEVLALTAASLARAGLRGHRLPVERDLDEPEDAHALAADRRVPPAVVERLGADPAGGRLTTSTARR